MDVMVDLCPSLRLSTINPDNGKEEGLGRDKLLGHWDEKTRPLSCVCPFFADLPSSKRGVDFPDWRRCVVVVVTVTVRSG
jgi:hypothetical protein